MEKNKINNVCCPYCNEILNAESFNNGKWQCRKCGRLLDFETFRKFYSKNENGEYIVV